MTPEPSYRQISLTQGQFAIIDAEDYDHLSAFKWHAFWNKATRSFYAVRNGRIPLFNARVKVYMHREILGLPYGDKRKGDHRNHNTLDNRRHNIRIADDFENMHNTGIRTTNVSGYKGVFNVKGKWRVSIRHKGGRIFAGPFATAEQAHKVWVAIAPIVHGDFMGT